MKALLPLLFCCMSSLVACKEQVAQPPANNGNIHVPSAAEISAGKEQYYARQLPVLLEKNPLADAQAAIARGERYFLCNAGRSITVPGIEPEVFAQVRANCPIQCLDGVTDALYGPNHQRYLQAALAYSARWNQTMLPACRIK